MEAFSIGVNDEEIKTKGDILDDEEPPYFDKEVTEKIPCYKTKIFIILVPLISIILIGIAAFVLIFIIIPNRKNKCDIENGFYIPDDKTKERNCLKCDLNCKKCHGSISHSQCDSCFDSFIPSFKYGEIKFCNKKCEEGKNNTCQICNTRENKCSVCNLGYFMPEDEERKVECQKCTVDHCDECSGTKNSIKCESCISSYSPIYEGNKIVKCICEEGEKEKCRICDKEKNECIACNEEYKLLNGICIPYSFKAIYNSDYAYLINRKYIYNIENMIIDGNETKPCYEYYFPKLGNHTVYFFLI